MNTRTDTRLDVLQAIPSSDAGVIAELESVIEKQAEALEDEAMRLETEAAGYHFRPETIKLVEEALRLCEAR